MTSRYIKIDTCHDCPFFDDDMNLCIEHGRIVQDPDSVPSFCTFSTISFHRETSIPELKAINAIMEELRSARIQHTAWPHDIVHAVAIVAEEAGEALQAANNALHHGKHIQFVKNELVQTGAMVIRALVNLQKGGTMEKT